MYHEAVQIAEVPVGLLVPRVPQICHTPEHLHPRYSALGLDINILCRGTGPVYRGV